MFQENHYGKPITEKLSTILRRNVSKNDFANIAGKTNISFSTIRDVVYRTNSLTKSNSKAIKMLVNLAYENSIAKKLVAEGDTLFLDKTMRV